MGWDIEDVERELRGAEAELERVRQEYGVALEMLLERGVRPAEVDARIRQRKAEAL